MMMMMRGGARRPPFCGVCRVTRTQRGKWGAARRTTSDGSRRASRCVRLPPHDDGSLSRRTVDTSVWPPHDDRRAPPQSRRWDARRPTPIIPAMVCVETARHRKERTVAYGAIRCHTVPYGAIRWHTTPHRKERTSASERATMGDDHLPRRAPFDGETYDTI